MRAARAESRGPTWASTRSRSTTTRPSITARWRPIGTFREEAATKGFRHFLEVFDPNAPQSLVPDLARLPQRLHCPHAGGRSGPGRPVFLKIVYHGPRAMQELVSYDSAARRRHPGPGMPARRTTPSKLREAQKSGAGRPSSDGRSTVRNTSSVREHLRRWPTAGLSPRGGAIDPIPRCGGWASGPIAAWKTTSGKHRTTCGSTGPTAATAGVDGSAYALEECGPAGARLRQDDDRRKARLEPGTLEADSGLPRDSSSPLALGEGT